VSTKGERIVPVKLSSGLAEIRIGRDVVAIEDGTCLVVRVRKQMFCSEECAQAERNYRKKVTRF
jgi:hypothetical protein